MVALALTLACARGERPAPANQAATADTVALAPAAPVTGSDSLPANRSFSAILSGFEMRVPDLWGQRYLATERRDPDDFPGATTVTEFVFLGMSGGMPPSLLTLVRYPSARWDALPNRTGTVVATTGKDVIVAQLPTTNPYPAGSDDARDYGAMWIAAGQVKPLITLVR